MKSLPSGWFTASPEEAKRLLQELKLELTEAHQLHGLPLELVAHRDGATDDILVRNSEQPEVYYVVHLTWRMGPEIDGDHPSIECAGSYGDFLAYERNFGT